MRVKQYTALRHKNQYNYIKSSQGTDFLIFKAITAEGYKFGNNQSIWAKFNNNDVNEEFPLLHEYFNTTTVIIEASNYYNSVQFMIWVLIDNITEI